jgi:large subunit ribosomal protein L21
MANYAIIRTGGKQYRADPGAVLTVEKLNAEQGAQVSFEQVLFLRNDAGVQVGTPTVEGALVRATVVEQGRDNKILIHKHKRRKKHRKTIGHRQWISRVRIDEIVA